MNRKARVVAALVLGVLLGSFAIWMRESGNPEPVRVPEEVAAAPLLDTLADSNPPHVAVPQEAEELAPVAVQGPPRESVFTNVTLPRPGYSMKSMPVDFDIYLQFMGIAAASEMADEQLVRNFQALHELTGEELSEVIKVARSALQSDRAFQAADTKALCERGKSFRSVEELGAALNESNDRIEANQEELGRRAMQQLDPVVAMKIRDEVLHRPRSDMGANDLAVIMAMRNHGLETELERVCSLAK